MGRRAVVYAAALAAVLLRFPGLMWPLRADEAGFLLVARAWDPSPDSLYGTYWVDRPPPIIALVKASDWLGGPYFLRWIAALGCVLLVLLAAAIARRIGGDVAAGWSAIATAVLVSSSLIDPIAAKGEVLGIPWVLLSVWMSLRALDAAAPAARSAAGRSTAWAAGAGGAAMLAVGLKQNLVGGLVFGGVLLIGALVSRRIDGRTFARLCAAALAGAALPVAATIGWTLAAGVRLDTLWYASFGMRSDALRVIESGSQTGPDTRLVDLLQASAWTGLALILVWLLVSLREVWRREQIVVVAMLAMLVADLGGLVLGGSYWPPYLLPLVPAAALAVGLVAGRRDWRGTGMRLLTGLAVVSSLVAATQWAVEVRHGAAPDRVYAGRALGKVAEPGDTLVTYGGRADFQYASGLPSPYQHLWSLPMRTLDPDLRELTTLLAGPDAPTWFVPVVPMVSWDQEGHQRLQRLVAERYVEAGDVCGEHIYRLRGVERADPHTDCDRRYR